MELWLGTKVRCGSTVVGDLDDVAVDPALRLLTHVVVGASHANAWLVPAMLVDGGRRGITLSCTTAELHALGSIREVAYMPIEQFPVGDDDTDVGVQDTTSMPSYEPTSFGDYCGEIDSLVTVSYDRIPKGEAELRRTSEVLFSSGHRAGHVRALVVEERKVTHVVLEHGHLWGRRDVLVPVDAVSSIATDSITLALAHDEVAALPSFRARS
jgi:sporulation protein YlmC with PRC-barrel domain